jgi:hypothetical protein
MPSVDADAIQRMWTLTLVVYGVVLIVVAVLLVLILGAARQVLERVAAIWTVGQQVANNTIHVALLDTTAHVAGGILESAKGVIDATTALKGHAEHCPGCPACVLGPEASR